MLGLTIILSANAQVPNRSRKDIKDIPMGHVVIQEHIDFNEALEIYESIPNRRMEKITITEPKSLTIKEIQNLVVKGYCPPNAVVMMDLKIKYQPSNSTSLITETRQLTCSRGTQRGVWLIKFSSSIADKSRFVSVEIGVKGYATIENEKKAASTNRVSIPIRQDNPPISTEKIINDHLGGKKIKKIPAPKGSPVN